MKIKEQLERDSYIQRPKINQKDVAQRLSGKGLNAFIRNLTVIFLIAVCSYYILIEILNSHRDSNTLTVSYLSDYHHAPSILMSGIEGDSKPWNIAIVSYKLEKFELAIEQIEKISNRTNEQNLYLALSRLYSNQQKTNLEKAILDLEIVLSSEHRIHEDEALWFISLAQILVKNNVQAKQNLIKIITLNSWNAKNAEQLLKTLQ